ncbi:MAG: hypothetical protein LBR91_00430 [Puniceicoccales bacterium]|nr:hypothetical protein [Puniceicoccales bacterium]
MDVSSAKTSIHMSINEFEKDNELSEKFVKQCLGGHTKQYIEMPKMTVNYKKTG